MKTRRFVLTLLACLMIPAAAWAGRAPEGNALKPEPQTMSFAKKWWIPRHEAKLKEAKANADKIHVIFLGDSITHLWDTKGRGLATWQKDFAPLGAINLGFSGDRTEQVIWRLQHGEVDPLAHAKAVVLMIGTNNTGHRFDPADQTAAGIKKIVDELRTRLPEAKILLLAIFPRGAKPTDRMRVRNDEVNKIIAGYADGQHVFYKDLAKVFLEPDGTLTKHMMPDLLHPSAHGYELWAKAIEPDLKKLMSEKN